MYFLKKKDINFRKDFKKNEKRLILRKFLITNLIVKNKLPILETFLKLNFVKRTLRKSRVKVVNRCIFTGRTKSISKKFNSSRFVLRNLMQFGLLPGYKKCVW